LLGPNGSGKTTLLRNLCGLLEPSRGQVLFRGVPVEAGNLPSYRRLVGFLPQDFNAYEGFTAEQFLNYWALERGLGPKARRREVERLIVQVGLEEAAKRKVRDFSGGMRRRIGIARSLLGDPPILIVDEPTTGLDVESRNRLRESLLSVAGERIILFSTHIASDVAAAASRILLLHQGRLLYDGSATGLLDAAGGRVFETLLDDKELREFSQHYRITTRVRTLEGVRVRAVTFGDQELAGDLVVPNLEEAYLAMLGEQPGSRETVSRGLGATLLDVEAWRS
jgi:ABC-type multidrug transport system ATPase subunit